MTGKPTVRWGIIGPGGIARSFFDATQGLTTGKVVALGTRSPASKDLATHFPGTRVHGSYASLIDDPEIDAIYIATPHPMHAEWAIAAAREGKHVLCEKPMSLSARQTEAMFEAARCSGTFLGEAYMYRLHPMTAAIIDLIRSGRIGDVRLIRSCFGFSAWWAKPTDRLFAKELGGGAVLDLGGYPMSMARLIAGAQCPSGFLEPDSIKASGYIGAGGVDEWSSAVLSFPNDIVADISCSVSVWQDNVLHIMGSEGRLEVDDFWFATGKQGGSDDIRLIRPDGTRENLTISEQRPLYSFQFEEANRAILAGDSGFSWPGMTREDSLGNARAVDLWMEQIGLSYDLPEYS